LQVFGRSAQAVAQTVAYGDATTLSQQEKKIRQMSRKAE
jgi:hypothetical protein